MMLALTLAMTLMTAPTPPPARAVWFPGAGARVVDALPPTHVDAPAQATTVAVIATRAAWNRLARAVPPGVALPEIDFERELALLVVADIASELEFQGIERKGARVIVRWSRSPYFVAFEPPQVLIVVTPRAGLREAVFRATDRDAATADLGPVRVPHPR